LFGASSFLQAFFIALIFIPLIMLWVFALADLFRRDDLGGGWKVLWLFAIIVLPIIGVIIYFFTRRPTRDVSMELPADQTEPARRPSSSGSRRCTRTPRSTTTSTRS